MYFSIPYTELFVLTFSSLDVSDKQYERNQRLTVGSLQVQTCGAGQCQSRSARRGVCLSPCFWYMNGSSYRDLCLELGIEPIRPLLIISKLKQQLAI